MKNLPCTNYSDVELGTVLGNHGQLWGGENCSGSDLAPGASVDDRCPTALSHLREIDVVVLY